MDSDRTTRITPFPRRDSTDNEWVRRYPHVVGYAFVAAMVVAMFASHLYVFVLSFLFLYLASDFITNDVRRLAPRFLPKGLLFSILYIGVLALLAVLFWRVIPNVIRRLPEVAGDIQSEAIKVFERVNARWGVTEYVNEEEVRGAIVSGTAWVVRNSYVELSSFSRGFVYFLFAFFANMLLYHNTAKLDAVFDRKPGTMMSFFYRFTMSRLRIFYFYFKRVMVGQAMISAVNTAISTIVIFSLGMPKPFLLIPIVFFCGLFPIVGNLASNTILTTVALVSISPLAALVCLGLLIGIHKLEYFLNSKIIGEIVDLPMFLTLTALVVCEVLLGIVGLILAIPLVLYIRHELEQLPGLEPEQLRRASLQS